MAAFKVLVFAVVAVALAAADESERVKKDVLVGAYPYGLGAPVALNYGYDDGKYYPGKYEKPTFYSAPAVATAYHSGAYVAPAAAAYVAPAASAYSYGAYPYAVGAYPYAKHVVY